MVEITKIFTLVALILSFTALADAEQGKSTPKPLLTVASVYSDTLHGKPTASGEPYDIHSMTAAHRTFPFNTRLLVMNVKNGKVALVRVNDRGPYVFGRGLDLSRAAWQMIADKGDGLIRVKIEVVK
jgi:rare lipoprotein A